MGRDLTNHIFGKLTVKEKFGVDKNRRVLWRCYCLCGNEYITPTRYLIRGSRVDCGCDDVIRNNRKSIHMQKPELPQLLNRLLDTYKHNSTKKSLDFKLSLEQFTTLIQDNCFYCNSKPSNIKKLRDTALYWNGIDRLDNSKGYIVDNCVTCCSECNYFKNSMDYDYFINKISVIYHNTLKE